MLHVYYKQNQLGLPKVCIKRLSVCILATTHACEGIEESLVNLQAAGNLGYPTSVICVRVAMALDWSTVRVHMNFRAFLEVCVFLQEF